MQDVSGFELVVRLVVSLGLVIGCMMLLGRFMRAKGGAMMGGGRKSQDTPLDVLVRKPLGRSSSIAIVRAGDRVFAIGVTEERVTHLADLDPFGIELDLSQLSAAEWTTPTGSATTMADSSTTRKGLLDQLKELTVRR
jgi:flagellar protein FliO/FliZ